MSVDRILQQITEDDKKDARFIYEVIRNLAESIREQTHLMSELQKDVHDIANRLTRIEANRLSESVNELKGKVEVLEADHQRREGALKVSGWLFKSPAFAYIVAVVAAAIAFFKDKQP